MVRVGLCWDTASTGALSPSIHCSGRTGVPSLCYLWPGDTGPGTTATSVCRGHGEGTATARPRLPPVPRGHAPTAPCTSPSQHGDPQPPPPVPAGCHRAHIRPPLLPPSSLPVLPFCNWERGRLAGSRGRAPGSRGQAIVLRRRRARESCCSRMNPAGAAISWCVSSIFRKKQTKFFLNQLRLLRDNNALYMVPYLQSPALNKLRNEWRAAWKPCLDLRRARWPPSSPQNTLNSAPGTSCGKVPRAGAPPSHPTGALGSHRHPRVLGQSGGARVCPRHPVPAAWHRHSAEIRPRSCLPNAHQHGAAADDAPGHPPCPCCRLAGGGWTLPQFPWLRAINPSSLYLQNPYTCGARPRRPKKRGAGSGWAPWHCRGSGQGAGGC